MVPARKVRGRTFSAEGAACIKTLKWNEMDMSRSMKSGRPATGGQQLGRESRDYIGEWSKE